MPPKESKPTPIRLTLREEFSEKIKTAVEAAPGVTLADVREMLTQRTEEQGVERWIAERSLQHLRAAGLPFRIEPEDLNPPKEANK